MPGSHSTLVTLSFVTLALWLAPATASAAPRVHPKTPRVAHMAKPRPCLKPLVEVTSGKESATLALATCQGSATPEGVDRLSALARSAVTSGPKDGPSSRARGHGSEQAPVIRRVDPRLVERIELVAEHFRKDGSVPRIVLTPTEGGPQATVSRHGMARSLDFQIEGVTGEALTAYCKTLPDTGCGYYPRDGHLRLDVRTPGSGRIAWVGPALPQTAAVAVPAAMSAPIEGVGGKLAPLPAGDHPASGSALKAGGERRFL